MSFATVFCQQEQNPCPHVNDAQPKKDSHDKKDVHDKKDFHDKKSFFKDKKDFPHDKKNFPHDKKDFPHDMKDFLKHKKDFHARKEACLRETNANNEDVKKAFREGVFTEDQSLKCFFGCMLQKNGVMNSAGAIDIEAFRAHMPPFVDESKALAALEKCKGANGSNPCETAFEFQKCMRKEMGPLRPHKHHREEKK